MPSPVLDHVLKRIADAPIRTDPYPHFYVRDVFPEDFYRELRAHLPPLDTYTTLKALDRVGKNYSDNRIVFPVTPEYIKALDQPLATFWTGVFGQFLTGEFMKKVLPRFRTFVQQYEDDAKGIQIFDEAFVVRDSSDYQLGPHTDSLTKMMSFLFYLPPDESMMRLGTSIYAPRQADFRCTKGSHYRFDKFQLVTTMPYVPNALFAFVRTNNSFHGVEPIAEAGVCRDLMLYDIQRLNPPKSKSIGP
jgi:hypothetical protein